MNVKMMRLVAVSLPLLGAGSVATAEEARSGGGGTSSEVAAIRQQVEAADAKVDDAVERVRSEATEARAALSRVGATATRARAHD